jgi:phosphatidylserine decarboxylase
MYTIERDGWRFIVLFALLGLGFLFLVKVLWPLGILFLLLAAGTAGFFRQPRIEQTFAKGEIVAPASGKVIDIREIEETDFLKQKVRRVSIFMSILDKHINYAPLAGEVAYLAHQPGQFKQAFREEASENNEAEKIGFRDGEKSWTIKQIAGIVARRIVCRCRIGDRLRAGQKLGMIRFGSRVELFFPLSAVFTVSLGEKVKGGRTVMGKMR